MKELRKNNTVTLVFSVLHEGLDFFNFFFFNAEMPNSHVWFSV